MTNQPIAEPPQNEIAGAHPPESVDKLGRCPLRAIASYKIDTIPILTVLLFIISLVGYWTFLGLPSDIASHFKPQYAILQFLCLIVVIVRKQPKWILIAFSGLMMNVAELAPYYLPPEKVPMLEGKPVVAKLKIMQMNVLTKNQSYDQAIQAIQTLNPDIIGFNEIDEKWLTGLQPVLAQYPHHIAQPRVDNFGIAIYSKIPFVKSKIHVFDKAFQIPSALAAVELNKQVVTILATHPTPPTYEVYYKARNQQLNEIIKERASLGENLIIVGDLNTTPWSDTYKRFLAYTGLKDTRLGFGLNPSWPTHFFPLQTPIDHVLVSDAFTVLNFKTGPNIGSDHFPVMAEVGFVPQTDKVVDRSRLMQQADPLLPQAKPAKEQKNHAKPEP